MLAAQNEALALQRAEELTQQREKAAAAEARERQSQLLALSAHEKASQADELARIAKD